MADLSPERRLGMANLLENPYKAQRRSLNLVESKEALRHSDVGHSEVETLRKPDDMRSGE
jgi:hypothetical protein